MNRVTLASVGFLAFAILVSAWLLLRPRATTELDGPAAASAGDSPVGLTFAEWSVRSDGVLLADIDPAARGGNGASTAPRRFLFVPVTRDAAGAVQMGPGRSFSWAKADRKETADSLFALGFRVSPEERAFVPPDDPLWSDPIAATDGATEQAVTLKAKSSGSTTQPVHFTRRRSDARSAADWGRRAIGFPSGDGHLVYVTPDAMVVSAEGR